MLTLAEVGVLKAMLQGRINAARVNKTIDNGERARLVDEYELILHKLRDGRLVERMTTA